MPQTTVTRILRQNTELLGALKNAKTRQLGKVTGSAKHTDNIRVAKKNTSL